MDELLERYASCCSCFASLVELTRQHPKRGPVLAAALRQGGLYIDTFLRGLPACRVLQRAGRGDAIYSCVTKMQKGTRILQIIANEAKARAATPLLAAAPATKRSLERFLFEMKALYVAGPPHAGAAGASGEGGVVEFYVGHLKLRDMAGNTVPSQVS